MGNRRAILSEEKTNLYLSEEAGLTPLSAMTQSFGDCDWLVVQEENKRFKFFLIRHILNYTEYNQ